MWRLLRVLIMLLIVGTLVVHLGPSVDLDFFPNPCGGGQRKARLKRTIVEIQNVGEALECFRAKNGGYPAGDLEAVRRALMKEGFLREMPRSDAWKRPYLFVNQPTGSAGMSEAYSMESLGCDGQPGVGNLEGDERQFARDVFLVSGKWVEPVPWYGQPFFGDPVCR